MVFGKGGGAEGLTALSDISLQVRDGECVCLLGPSGCGKSTLLNLVAGFLQPTEGSVTLNGEEIKEPGPDRGMVFQEPTLYNWLSVFDNVAFGLKMRGVAKTEIRERVTRFLALTGLAGFEQFPPYELSGGMKQRVALSRVLVSDPKVLLMDEPFSALDPSTRQEMQSLLDSLQDRRKCTILLVTHDINEALYLADRILVFSARPGRIIDEIDLRGVSFTDRRSEIIERPDMTALHKRIMEAVTQKE
ncbi:MAG: ABC transporter ATP-binding protein [Lachnospiraceae bacterium]|nr:ABC transporter ATP-binding protein [Lachnospiraceae bacterium]MBQ6904319.1 ABC transporter ATP-binding protein [Lachnospiraceae bacterium]